VKLIVLLYLEDDEACVDDLLGKHDVTLFSRTSVEGIGPGAPGWYGTAAPYRSRMVIALVEPDLAGEILEAVESGTGLKDSRHPIHALQLDVERQATCGGSAEAGGAS
jgi:hypothetical protein